MVKIDSSGWSEVPGNGITDVALAAAFAGWGMIYLFRKGLDDNKIYLNTFNHLNNAWSGWSEVPGDGNTDAGLAAASIAGTTTAGNIYLFRKGLDDRVYLNILAHGPSITSGVTTDTWSGWSEVPGGGATDVALAAAALLQDVYLFRKGLDDNRIYFNRFNRLTRDWSGWSEVPGGVTTNVALAAAPFSDGPTAQNIYLSAKGINDKIYLNTLTQDPFESDPMLVRTWSGWNEVPGGGATDVALAATFSEGGPPPLSSTLFLFRREIDDNRTYLNMFDRSNNTWSAWSEVPDGGDTSDGTTDVAPAVALVSAPGVFDPLSPNVHLFAKGVNDKRVYANTLSITL
jgi:hypothetical protein